MSVTVRALAPVHGAHLEVLVTCEAGYEMIRYDLDNDGHRFVIVFCQAGRSTSMTEETITTPWVQDDEFPNGHSLTAIGVVGNAVVSKDRRIVRDGHRVP